MEKDQFLIIWIFGKNVNVSEIYRQNYFLQISYPFLRKNVRPICFLPKIACENFNHSHRALHIFIRYMIQNFIKIFINIYIYKFTKFKSNFQIEIYSAKYCFTLNCTLPAIWLIVSKSSRHLNFGSSTLVNALLVCCK